MLTQAPTLRKHPLHALGVLGLGAAATVALTLGAFKCPIASVFHVPCPACGSTRAVRALLHGDLAGVVRWNVVAPFTVLLLAFLGLRTVWAAYLEGARAARMEGRAVAWSIRLLLGCVAIEIVVWLARFGGFLGGPVPV